MTTNGCYAAFGILFLFRYIRLFVNCIWYHSIRAIPIPPVPTLGPRDVTVIIPTCFEAEKEFLTCFKSVSVCNPAKIIIITACDRVRLVQNCLSDNEIVDAAVLGIQNLNKRQQMARGLKEVRTKITIFVDDDVFWPNRDYIKHLLACFEHPEVGAAGTCQSARRECNPNIWNFLGICYLERRNFNTCATNYIDGGVSTLPGRTAAYRTSIIQSEEFYAAFLNDRYLGKILNTDDDKFLTRWIYSHDWKIMIQSNESTVLETTLQCDRTYLHQCMRWARAHWRGNFTVMRTTKYWWKKHTWTFYAVYLAQFQTPALVWDGLLIWTLKKSTSSWAPNHKLWSLTIYLIFLLFTKVVKIIPHLRRHPLDIRFIPLAILFSYSHGLINLLALCTLNETRFYTYKKLEQEKLEKLTDE